MKILVNGPDFFNYTTMIAKGFMNPQNEVIVSNWPNLNGNFMYNSKIYLYNKISKSFDPSNATYDLNRDVILQYNKTLLDQINIFKPDLVLTLKGDILVPDTVKCIKEKADSIHAIWCYDSALRFSNVLNSAKYYDLFYTFEFSDIQKLQNYKINSKYLPMAYDPDSYFCLENKTKTIDICFIGNLNPYPHRKKLFEEIISKYKDLNIELWGKTWTWYNPFLNYEYNIKRKQLGNHINNFNVDSDKINTIYNSSKICINIHHPQSINSLNPRTFEILGSGGFELVDYKSSLNNLFDIGNELESYSNKTELFEKIDYYINNERRLQNIANRGHNKVLKYHTYKNRANTIIQDMESF